MLKEKRSRHPTKGAMAGKGAFKRNSFKIVFNMTGKVSWTILSVYYVYGFKL